MKENIANKIQSLIKIDFNNERVLTTNQLAMIYETKENNIQMNFSNNKERFIKGKHYYLLKGEDLKEFKNRIPNDIGVALKYANSLYLWTEKGANRHCKILDTDKAWEQFDVLEETYFKVRKDRILSSTELLELQLQAIKENANEIRSVNEDLQSFKVNIPLFGDEQDDLQKAVRYKGTSLLGGKNSPAYKDKSLRQRLYSDLQKEIKRQFGVRTYKAIKRCQLDIAKNIVDKYTPPLILQEEISSLNS
ncbi:MAG: hypothetical protein E7214_08180 [Clostridium sp.]|nr:hypothetical protein [Clostridium sp.]